MHSGSGDAGEAWSKVLFRHHRDAMPRKVRRSCDALAECNQWELMAAGVLEWAMQDQALTDEEKVAALAFVQAGMFGRSSAHLERRLSSYRPPIGPGPTPRELKAKGDATSQQR